MDLVPCFPYHTLPHSRAVLYSEPGSLPQFFHPFSAFSCHLSEPLFCWPVSCIHPKALLTVRPLCQQLYSCQYPLSQFSSGLFFSVPSDKTTTAHPTWFSSSLSMSTSIPHLTLCQCCSRLGSPSSCAQHCMTGARHLCCPAKVQKSCEQMDTGACNANWQMILTGHHYSLCQCWCHL